MKDLFLTFLILQACFHGYVISCALNDAQDILYKWIEENITTFTIINSIFSLSFLLGIALL